MRTLPRTIGCILFSLVLCLLFFAGTTMAQSGFTGPGPGVVSVAHAKTMADDAPVTLQGNIVQHLGGERYLFKDDSGTITVDIDDDKWGTLKVGPGDLVKISGEVDKDWNKVEIDVDHITKVDTPAAAPVQQGK